ncbi:MAG: hypothetical protein HYW24_05335 [Candidatus Aenigmarchaeota archaeon]|nr:hypothetical protein [Candidatus Aenigmarchaeota archaeon]
MREYHQIDSSVYLRGISDEAEHHDPNLFSTYIGKLGRTFKCDISVIVLGEITKRICEIFFNNKKERDYWLETLGDFLVKQDVKALTILEDDVKLFHELRGVETRAHEPELLALAIAINHKADVFMTFDGDLLHSAPLFKQKYGIKVRKPV